MSYRVITLDRVGIAIGKPLVCIPIADWGRYHGMTVSADAFGRVTMDGHEIPVTAHRMDGEWYASINDLAASCGMEAAIDEIEHIVTVGNHLDKTPPRDRRKGDRRQNNDSGTGQ